VRYVRRTTVEVHIEGYTACMLFRPSCALALPAHPAGVQSSLFSLFKHKINKKNHNAGLKTQERIKPLAIL
jgi:hypothetical protein